MACPTSLQGPVPKQVNDIMTVLGDPREALKEAGLTQKQVKAPATATATRRARRSSGRWRAGGQGGRGAPMGSGTQSRRHADRLA